jgi:hypothetical protein
MGSKKRSREEIRGHEKEGIEKSWKSSFLTVSLLGRHDTYLPNLVRTTYRLGFAFPEGPFPYVIACRVEFTSPPVLCASIMGRV